MRSSAHRHLWLLLATLALTGALFLPGASLYRWDTLVYSWPLLLETRAQWLSGHWPFWAGSICNGTPLLENINAGVLYPLRALLWLLPLKVGYALFLALHVALALYGMEALLRRGLGLRGWAPLVGALVYAASGYARGMWDTHNFVALPWLPWGLLALWSAARPGHIRSAALGVATVWTLLLLSGDLQAAALWIPVAALAALLHPARRRLLGALALGLLIALPLSALQWLPAWAAAQESYRAGGLDLHEALERSFHPARLLELVLPYGLGTRDGWAGARLMGEGALRQTPWTSSAGLGLVTLLLLPLAVRRARRPAVRWALLVCGGSLLLALGRFLPGYAAWQNLPVISAFRYPEKYLLWFTLAAAVLAGSGFARWQAWSRRSPAAAGRYVSDGALCLLFAGLASAAALRVLLAAAPPPLLAPFCLVVAVVLGLRLAAPRGRLALCVVHVAALLVPWYFEAPVTRRFDPLEKPITLTPLPAPSQVGGRVLADPAVQAVPLPPDWATWRPTERQAEFYREHWMFNMPTLWGYDTAGGFSPAESGAMRQLRDRLMSATSATGTALFCRLSAVEWLLTTPQRLADLQAVGLAASRVTGWGGSNEVVLVARIDAPARAGSWGQPAVVVTDVWRPRPGFTRVDIQPGTGGWLRLADAFARGWRATDQHDRLLETAPLADAFLGVRVRPDTTQVRLTYRPTHWAAAVRLSLLGLVAWLVLGHPLVRDRVPRLLAGPILPALAATAAALLLGTLARGAWACTFDEGFHVARGVGLASLHDSRLSYFHPPLQNALGGYFLQLAHGPRLDACPEEPGWQQAEVQAYAMAVAARNRDRFPDFVQAARWGSALLYALLCIGGVWGAHRWGGATAAWLAAAGLALQPSLLAHGHLATTDMGVAAFAVCGTVMLARSLAQDGRGLGWAVLAFVLASAVKFSGLIWLGSALLIVLPMLAWRLRRPALLAWIPLGALLLAGVLLLLYGPAAQEIRGGTAGSWPAGRFFEGLVRQSDHALAGHRGYLAGAVFQVASWWHAPLTLLLKVPEVWCAAALFGAIAFLPRLRRPAVWAAVPALVFAALLMFAGKLSLGVRHLLPLLALGVIAGAVAVARLRLALVRRAVCATLVAGSVLALAGWPNLISYVPAWAGGLPNGPAWVADSNFDWGQDIGRVEERWAGLVEARGGQPPTLYYYGFLDPAYLYHLPVGPGSYLGFMGRGRDLSARPAPGRITVASASATALNPHGLPLSAVTNGALLGTLSPSYRIYEAR